MDIQTDSEKTMDIMQLMAETRKLIEKEKMSDKPGDISPLEDAMASLEQYAKDAASDKMPVMPEKMDDKPAGVVDTGVLNGPISGLKNFLIKTQRDNEGA